MNLHPVSGQSVNSGFAACLNMYRLPARLDVKQTASLLGFQPHDIPVLVAAKLIQPLGKPVPNAPKYFAACVLEELRGNPDWLDRATRAVSRRWQLKNGKRALEGFGVGQGGQSVVGSG
jgi:hypothetical protein